MNASKFIAGRLRFKGKIAVVCITVSFFVIIVAVAVSSGFRREIKNGVASISGDVQLAPASLNIYGGEDPIDSDASCMEYIEGMKEIGTITPVVYRAGVVKSGNDIQGVVFKGVPSDGASLEISVPSRLSEMLSIAVGDKLTAYFVGEKVKARKFTVKSIYPSILDSQESLIIYAGIKDLQRLNGWEENEVSVMEITMKENHRSNDDIRLANENIGALTLIYSSPDEPSLVATSSLQRFPHLFSWLDLIDFNVMFILLLMTVVAGFNMISGLLILLFQNISTIGILKSMGMTDRNISEVFLRVSSNLLLKGMAVGNVIALAFCALQHYTHILKLNPENYFVSFVPVKVNVPMVILSDAVCYVVIMVLLLIPSLFISKVDPAKTVRAQ